MGLAAPAAPSRAAPALSDVTQSHRTWRSSDGKGKHRRPVGTRFGFTLSEAAKVRLTFTVQLPGRRLGRGCVRVTRRNRRHHACTRRGSSNSLTKAGVAGVNSIEFAGRTSASARLAPGKYTLVITATANGLSTRAPRHSASGSCSGEVILLDPCYAGIDRSAYFLAPTGCP